jgi:hypothetical protein
MRLRQCVLGPQDSESTEKKLLQTLEMHGFHEGYLKQLYLNCTDGASVTA